VNNGSRICHVSLLERCKTRFGYFASKLIGSRLGICLWVEQMIEENISITDLAQWVLSEVPLKMAQMGNLRGRAWLLETSNLKQIDDRKENEIGQGLNPMSGILLLQVNFTSNN
jgi:hypothetical protein